MTIRSKAVITDDKGAKQALELVQEEPKVFRWWNVTKNTLLEEVSETKEKAISRLRFIFDDNPAHLGWDLTFFPVADPPEERAALAIMEHFSDLLNVDDHGKLVNILREHTNVTPLADSVVAMLTHFVNVLGNTDPIASGLMLNVVVELSKTTGDEYAGVKKLLSTPPKPKVDTSSRIIIPGRR